METPHYTTDTFNRFTLHKVEDLEAEEIATEENLDRKYTKKGLNDFVEKIREDPEVRLDNLENYRVTVQEVEEKISTLRAVISKSEVLAHGRTE